MLQTFSVPAGGRQIDAKATFFRYEASNAYGVDETIRVRGDGQDLGSYLPGDSITLPTDCKRWEIAPKSPLLTCTVRLGVGLITSSRIAGSVSIVDRVGGSCQTMLLPDVSIGFSTTAYVLPAANLNGILVRSSIVEVQAGSGTGAVNCRLFAAPTAPASLSPGASSLMLNSGRSLAGDTDIQRSNFFDMRSLIPPGWGLWHAKNAPTVTPITCSCTVSFEIL